MNSLTLQDVAHGNMRLDKYVNFNCLLASFPGFVSPIPRSSVNSSLWNISGYGGGGQRLSLWNNNTHTRPLPLRPISAPALHPLVAPLRMGLERQGASAGAEEKSPGQSRDRKLEYPRSTIDGDSCAIGTIVEVPRISDYIDDLPLYPNPAASKSTCQNHFVDDTDGVLTQVVVNSMKPRDTTMYLRAGPREKVVFRPEEVRAAIVTCGGLCPGLNVVIREVTDCLWNEYGVREIFGVQNGYRGFYSSRWIKLTPETVDQIHKQGGSYLGNSRGGHDTMKIVDALEARNINHLYIVGGDGTIRGAAKLAEEIRRRRLAISVVNIPKTIDNDIPIIDRSFGFETAVEEALRAVNAANVEATCFPNGVGLVKLMGRNSGFIAVHTTMSSRDVDCCLIPEVDFHLEGPGGLLEFIEKRLESYDKCVIVVAEGAGQNMIQREAGTGIDPSGNKLLKDIGLYLQSRIKSHFEQQNMELSLKYIDPTYMIRAVPSCASDNLYCTMLAHMAVHGAFAGFTGFTVGPVNGFHTYLPFDEVTGRSNVVDPTDRHWVRLVSSTGQPDYPPSNGVKST